MGYVAAYYGKQEYTSYIFKAEEILGDARGCSGMLGDTRRCSVILGDALLGNAEAMEDGGCRRHTHLSVGRG
jgi:hypothetical protein